MKRRRRRNNPQRPPRLVVCFEAKITLVQKLVKFARAEGVSVSKLINDWLCESLDIEEKLR